MQQRLRELDLLRALALVGVLVIHAAAWSVPVARAPLTSPLAALADLGRCAVPAFVLASGFALRARRAEPPAERLAFLRRRWARTLLPWLCWVPVFLSLGLADGAIPAQPGGVASWFAYGAGHLYFLLLIAQLYLVFLVLPRSRRLLAAATAAALAVQLLLGWLHTYRPLPGGPLGWPFGSIAYWQAPYYAGYFLAGALLADVWPRLRAAPWLGPVSLAAVVATVGLWAWSATTVPDGGGMHGAAAFLWPGRLPLVLAVAVAVLAHGHHLASAASTWLGSRSLGVYLTHPLFLVFAGPAAFALGPAARFAALLAGSLLFGCLAVVALKRTRLGAAAIGEEAPAPRSAQRVFRPVL